jgi:hypothetical protein
MYVSRALVTVLSVIRPIEHKSQGNYASALQHRVSSYVQDNNSI